MLGVDNNYLIDNYDIYTADDEEPICTRCEYFGGGFDCENSCGSKKAWCGYLRLAEKQDNN